MGNKASLMLQDAEIQQISEETGFSPTQVEKLYSRFAHLDRGNCGSLSRNDLLSIPELAINPLCDRLVQMFFAESDQQEDDRINFRQFMRVLANFRPTNGGSSSIAPSQRQRHNTQSIPSKNRRQTSSKKIEPSNQDIMDHHSFGKSQQEQADEANPQRTPDKTTRRRSVELYDALRDRLLFVFRIYDVDNDGRISFNDLRSILKMMVGNYIDDLQLDKIATRAFVEVDEDSDGFIEFSEFCKVFSGKDLDEKLRVKFFH